MPRATSPQTRKHVSARKPYVFLLIAACCAAFGLSFSPRVVRSQSETGAPRSLSLDERVAHQRAVEEVYWRHAVWPKENPAPKPALDEVVPMEATRAKVEDTLRKSDALARHWNRPVSAEQLQAELTRMARETRRPEVLRELWGALGDDPFLIAEVLARPALVERLARTSFDSDEKADAAEATRTTGGPKASFDSWWEGESQQYVADAATYEGFAYRLAEISNAAADDTWSPTQALPVTTGTAVWTGTEVIIWGGSIPLGGRTNSGSRYNPATDTWAPTTTVGAPRARSGHAAYWTGAEMLIWGGVLGVNCGGDGPCRTDLTNTGARYNPLTDTWTPTSTSGAPFTSGLTVWTGKQMLVHGGSTVSVYDPSSDDWKAGSPNNTPGVGSKAIWTGAEMFIWGGVNNTTGKRGGLYNPETDTWRQPNTFNAPSERTGFSLVWTGTEAVVWGGYEGNNVTLNTGARYNPQTDTWTATSTTNAPAARYGHTAVWTGSEMVVHGGDLRPLGQVENTNTGGRYNPFNDSWTPTPTAKSPVKFGHVAVWTGTEVFVWGGQGPTGAFQKEGARFSPSKDSWTPANNNDAPFSVDRGVWTGTEMLIWGQNSLCIGCPSVGGRYDPSTNVWRPMNLAGAPVAFAKGYGVNAVWTGKEMIVWGGGRGRYNPLTDTWAAISSTNAPSDGFSAVWTGKEMIVWGSSSQENADTGGRYNPETDTWRPTSTVGTPTGRGYHTAVWTGSEMIVWGGVQFGVSGKLSTGGRYNPETDTWRPTSTAGGPEGRAYHTAVWAGSSMVVWGGRNDDVNSNTSLRNTGGRYDPSTDTWTPTGTVGAPEARSDHRAVWTGTQMIVWGGTVKGVNGPFGTYTGARYNPSTDVWVPTSTLGAPSKRFHQVQVWTGTQMIVWGGTADEGAATHGAVYNAPGASPAGNLPPTVRLTAPAGGSAYQSGDTVQLAAEVSDPDGAVTTVRFYANNQLVGTDTQSPFAFAWSEVRGGDYALTATATDDGGAEARSAALNISVAPSTAPPVCVLTSPADGAAYAYNDAFYMEATATANRDRSITKVEFLDNDKLLTYYETPTFNAPWRYFYQTRDSGTRSLTARCTDSAGGITTSAPKVITVAEQGFTVGGQVLDDRGFTIAGVRLRLDGPAGTAPRYVTTTVAGNGNYSFGGLKAGETYTVTPEPGAFKFTPGSNTYTAISRSYNLENFTATRAGYAITGRLTDAGGNPIYPATVNLSGSKVASANVLSDGTYFFYNLAAGGTYTVQPYKNLYTFAPNFRTFENLSADQAADFTGTVQAQTYAIGGRVVDDKGAPVAGLTVRLDTVLVTNTQTRTTDADGRYSFATVQAGENCMVSVQDATNFYVFAPANRSYVKLAQDVTDANFVANKRTFVITGILKTADGRPIYPATVNLSGSMTATAATNSEGTYFFGGLARGGDYTVRPSKENYDFSPQEKTFTALADSHVADFTGTARPTSYSIAGRVLDSAGLPVGGLRVRLNTTRVAGTQYRTTDVHGYYSFSNIPVGETCAVWPDDPTYAYGFSPASRTYASMSQSAGDAHFVATARTVRGRITQAGSGLAGVTVTLEGPQTGTVTTGDDGAFSFEGVTLRGDYNVSASRSGYTFTPARHALADLKEDATVNFDASSNPPTPEVRPRFAVAEVTPFEEGVTAVVVTVRRTGDLSQPASVDYETADETARQGYDYMMARGTLRFAAAESEKQLTLIIIDDGREEADETFLLKLSSSSADLSGEQSPARLVIKGGNETATRNPADEARFFARQHYADFLNRVPDDAGLDHWAGGIEACGADAQCLFNKRTDTSAAFFLSIEFQETGFLVHRTYKSAYGEADGTALVNNVPTAIKVPVVHLNEFIPDSQAISRNVVVGTPGWPERLAANKTAFALEFVARPRFTSAFPSDMTPAAFVDKLIANAGVTVEDGDRQALIDELAANNTADGRASVLTKISEGAELISVETNKAFVLMQYFGYMRRDPNSGQDADHSGYNFWLRKLEDNGGDWRAAQMVFAFIDSIEYRQRFAQ